jgi:GntR family transcriptional repressor for pyruvate dehydrogenase complex
MAEQQRPSDVPALRPVNRPKLYEQVVDRLREHVAAAGLHVGDRLPAERDLAARLGVSRTSVRQAIVALEVQGLVEVRHGGGIFLLREHWAPEPLARMLDRRRRLPDVLEARDALETKTAALAARRRTEDDLREIDAALEDMRRAIKDGELGEHADRRFHGAITSAARNPLIAEAMANLADRIAESRTESLRQPGRPAQSLAQHLAVAEAIRRGDPEAAATAMHIHVSSVGKVKLLEWSPADEPANGDPGNDE